MFSSVQSSLGRYGLCVIAAVWWMIHAPAAQAFDRQAQTQRYLQWVQNFERDMQKLAQVRQPSDADIERLFATTIVPSSRAVSFVRELAQQEGTSVAGGVRYQGTADIAVALLKDAVVAGDGGLYTDHPPGQAELKLRVLYLHFDGAGRLERHFSDKELFPNYHLPADGKLERGAYPFLLFDDGPTLRLGAITPEFWDIVRFLSNSQFG